MQYKQLTLLHQKIYNLSVEIQAAIEKKDYENITISISKREKLTQQLESFKDLMNDKDSMPQELRELREKLEKIENSNMKNLLAIRDDLKNELEKVNKEAKVVSAYSQEDIIKPNIIDISE